MLVFIKVLLFLLLSPYLLKFVVGKTLKLFLKTPCLNNVVIKKIGSYLEVRLENTLYYCNVQREKWSRVSGLR